MWVQLPLSALMKWTSNLAYAVGLITSDGCLSPDGRHITLTSVDKQLLNTFKKCLNKNCKISLNPKGGYTNKKMAYRVQFSDVKLYNWLLKIGITPNKSLTIGPLKINLKYFRDFLRGHLDGDGSIIHYKDKYLTHIKASYVYDRLFIYFISASSEHLKWLRSQITLTKGLRGSISKTVDLRTNQKGSSMYKLKFSTKEAKQLLNWIYYKLNLPKLKRKFKIAEPYLVK